LGFGIIFHFTANAQASNQSGLEFWQSRHRENPSQAVADQRSSMMKERPLHEFKMYTYADFQSPVSALIARLKPYFDPHCPVFPLGYTPSSR
jgi:hypothetical protein